MAVLIQTAGQLFSDHLRTRQASQSVDRDSVEEFFLRSKERFAPFVTTDAPVSTSTPKPTDTPIIITQPQPAISTPAQTMNINVIEVEPEPPEGQAEAIATGCVPCSLGHFGTCAGLINEAVRFSDDGLNNNEVKDRALMCLQELNAMERVDLRPEMIAQLEGKERQLAEQALKASRNTRHIIENMKTPQDLVNAASKITVTQREIGRKWWDLKLSSLSEADRAEVNQRVEEKLKELEMEATNGV